SALLRHLPPFPTRRSSDLLQRGVVDLVAGRDRLEVVEGTDVSTHATSVRPTADIGEQNLIVREPVPIARSMVMVCGGQNPHKPRSEEHTSELQSRFDLVCR